MFLVVICVALLGSDVWYDVCDVAVSGSTRLWLRRELVNPVNNWYIIITQPSQPDNYDR